MALAVYPSFSRIAEGGALARGPGLLVGAAGGAAGLAIAVALRWFAGPLIDVIFGPDFGPAAPLLRQLAWALPGAYALMTMGAVYAGWRRQTVSLRIMLAAFALSATLNILWIPSMGVAAPAAVAPLAFTAAAFASAVAVVFLRPRELEAG
jgi:O-antigen/teichoic acid export membrane protein